MAVGNALSISRALEARLTSFASVAWASQVARFFSLQRGAALDISAWTPDTAHDYLKLFVDFQFATLGASFSHCCWGTASWTGRGCDGRSTVKTPAAKPGAGREFRFA